MPIISHIGAKSWKVRTLYGLLFVILGFGSITMIVPLLLMLSGSVKSASDYSDMAIVPKFWFDDAQLFQKYAESKYNGATDLLEQHWQRQVGTWRNIEPPAKESEYLADYLEWRGESRWWWLGNSGSGRFMEVNAREFRAWIQERYHDDIAAFRQDTHLAVKSWGSVNPPGPNPFRFSNEGQPFIRLFREFAQTRPVSDRAIINLDGRYLKTFLIPTYTDSIAEYNRTHGTNAASYQDVLLTRRAPATGLAREDWEKFVREQLALDCIRIDATATASYRNFIASRNDDIAQYNRKMQTAFGSFDEIPFSASMPSERLAQVDWEAFIRDRARCPLDALEVYGPRQAFEEFVAARRKVPAEKIAPLRLPIYEADYHDAIAGRDALRWEFSTRNYKHVLDYVLLHGNGVWNTLIYCLLAISTSLIVNPIAAYSLSRFKPPSTYAVLLFCMATMAFPGEVTMIPAFLLQRSFPLWPLAGGCVAFFLTWILLGLIGKKMQETLRALLALGVGLLAGAWAVPAVVEETHISLLNTFAALVLPGMANGFSIFLLKGFFDSLPQELYEAAEIDGASEWTKFWTFTMSLSKPILAVIALGAFNGAYSAFMMALIVIPDPKMWTLMVWLYQLQNYVHASVVYAALVVTAIPTLLIFIFCQNMIMRGIVVPTEK